MSKVERICSNPIIDLVNADCLSYMKGMDDKSVELIITSPPYPGVCNMWGDLYKTENFDQAHDFLERVWIECIRVLNDGCKLAIVIANTKRRPYLTNVAEIYKRLKDKIEPLGEIIWNKGYGQCGTAWGSFRCPSDPSLADQHEYILILRKYGDRGKPEIFDKIDLFEFKSWRNSIWRIPPAKASEIGHIAPFPIEIARRLITLYSFKSETVLDPFSGSNTVGLECIRLNRNFLGCELDSGYYEKGKARLLNAMQQQRISFDKPETRNFGQKECL